jgi:hypothetical protein
LSDFCPVKDSDHGRDGLNSSCFKNQISVAALFLPQLPAISELLARREQFVAASPPRLGLAAADGMRLKQRHSTFAGKTKARHNQRR